ncbi:hypothetical protein [Sphingomonas montanisoli]|uniref:Uncharacterized protein n=1 Tax=Sphingomonas montanisoli TaxID=2606412 RepID=A0A5D9CDR3_9SPHN|nr:hypothetical protein [Sphingomonas montanisoli]TZG29353.1 hypothetical protein FYJ91_04315 [Sphingomonas montanisoli]
MSINTNGIIRDLGIRIGGAALVTIGVLAIGRAEALEEVGPLHPGVQEYLMAAIGFLALSTGAMLLILGIHIFDRVRISSRWASTSDRDPPSANPGRLASRTGGSAL